MALISCGKLLANNFPQEINNISFDDKYLKLSGGTMTGDLILNGAPTADNQAATKKYVDDKIGSEVEIFSYNGTTNVISRNWIDFNINVPIAIKEYPLIRMTAVLFPQGIHGSAPYCGIATSSDDTSGGNCLLYSVRNTGSCFLEVLTGDNFVDFSYHQPTIMLMGLSKAGIQYIKSGALTSTATTVLFPFKLYCSVEGASGVAFTIKIYGRK